MKCRMLLCSTALVFFLIVQVRPGVVEAQTPSPTRYPLPFPNVLLIYNQDTLTMINVSPTPISLAAFTFMRAGGVVKYAVSTLSNSLAPGHCVQWWTAKVTKIPNKPDECAVRDRYARLGKDSTYFWVGSYENEPFRPQLRGSAVGLCSASAGRCSFYLPQGNDAMMPWPLLDPVTGLPMPAGIQVAYDNNQLWIGNLTPNTVLPTSTLRLFYTVNGEGIVWTASKYDSWDSGPWNNRSLMPGECIVLYADPTKVTPLLPCTPVGKSVRPEQPWTLKFDVMGPREERRTPCGTGQPTPGPVLCLVGG